jgi:gliding motility-associated-like protein
MRNTKAGISIIRIFFFWVLGSYCLAQCPDLPTSDAVDHTQILCEGDMLTMMATGENIAIGSTVDWYITQGTENPYNGDGVLIGSSPVTGDPCNNAPEVLYIMVNPDNTQVGGSGDQCDEFVVLWTGSGGFMTSDILVSNLGPGTFQWDSFVAGNAANFSCGTALPPGAVPPNAILIIQSSPNNNVFIDADNLCASGLPVYIIAYDGTGACTGGYFDNDSPCASCPVMFDITGVTCQYDFELNYMPPASSTNGWAWANTGSGVYADVIPVLDIPAFDMTGIVVEDFLWTIPQDFCEDFPANDYFIVGIPNPPPPAGCPQITTSYFGFDVQCGTVMLSGGGDICAGNCPEAPNTINFTIEGEGIPYTADFVITASLFPPFTIPDVPITSAYFLNICLEGLFPSYDPSTNTFYVPELAIGLTATLTVTSLVSANGCAVEAVPNSVSLHFIDAPTVNTGPDQTICAHETVSVSGNIGGSAFESEWITSGDGTFADPSALSTTYTPGPDDIDDGQVDLTLTATDENGACIPAESTISITIDPSLLIEVNTPLTICNNDVANVIAMVSGSDEPCNWETSGDGSFDDPFSENTIYTPGTLDLANGSVTLFFTPVDPSVCIESIEPLVLNFVEAPESDIPLDLEICEGDSVVIEIEVEGPYTNIMWSAPGDGILVVENNMQITYTPGPMDIDEQFFIVSVMIQSVFPECGVITYNIPVNIVPCDCPPFETIAPLSPLCYDNDLLDLTGLVESGGAGTWTITAVPPGTDPATIIGNIFTTNTSDPGQYTVTYTLQSPDPGCPPSSSENILVQGLIIPFAGPDMAFCGPQSVLVDGIVTPAINTPIMWEALGDGSFLDNTSLSTLYTPGPLDSIAPGLYLVLHSLDTLCGIQSDTVTLFFNAPPFATFTNDTIAICNVQANGSVINFFSLITGGDATGNWTNVTGVPVDFSNPAQVDFDGIAEGYYAFQYETNSALSPCAETVYTIIISVEECLCPLLVVQNVPDGICNSQGQLPLNAFVMAGAPGNWQVTAVPPGSNPGTVAGSDFIINGCDPGFYTLRFTFDTAPIDGCPDSAEIQLYIQEEPGIEISGDTITCGQSMVQLNAVISGSSTGVVWSTSGAGVFIPPSQLNTEYTPSILDVASAQVLLFATSVDTFGFCTPPSDTIQLFIVTPPSTGFSALTATLCNDPDSGSVVNLFSFIVEGDGTGIWTDLDGAGIDLSDPSQVDFDGFSTGIYRISYTTQTAVAPCTDSVYIFNVVIEDCTCPALNILTDLLELCQSDTRDLNEQVINAAPGVWSITQGPSGTWPVITGSTLTSIGAAGGSYQITYTLIDSVPGCLASISFPLVVESRPDFDVTGSMCNPDQTLYEVMIETDAILVSADFGTITDLGGGNYIINAIPANQNIEILASGPSGICVWLYSVMAPNCNCTLFTEDIADTVTLCPGDTIILIPFVTGAQGLPFSTWVTPTGSKMRPTLPLFMEGEYIWIVLDSAGCEERDTFYAIFIGPETADLTAIPPSCPDSDDGQIVIQSVTDGTPPYEVQLDNGIPVQINQLPFIIDLVGIGNHQVSITDIIGCSLEIDINVNNQNFGTLELGPNVIVIKGDSVLIDPSANGIEITTVNWNPEFIDLGIEPFWYKPDSTISIAVTVMDTAGCIYQDQLLITVIEKETFYIPTIFSPNGDQINDEIEVHTSLPADRMVSFQIFDRWGGLIHAQYEAAPFGWDGTSKNRDAISGVYVYKLTWKDDDGKTQVKIGDITLTR